MIEGILMKKQNIITAIAGFLLLIVGVVFVCLTRTAALADTPSAGATMRFALSLILTLLGLVAAVAAFLPERKPTNIRTLTAAALFAALCTVMTMVVQVPSPMQGYVNLGDCAVLLSAWVLGPWYGGAAAGLGSMLADLLSYPHYAPGTLVIKFTMAVAAAYIFEAMRERSGKLAAQLIGGAAAEIIMVLGYFGYASLWLGKGLAAAASIPGNLVQGVFGIAAGIAVYAVLDRSHVLARA